MFKLFEQIIESHNLVRLKVEFEPTHKAVILLKHQLRGMPHRELTVIFFRHAVKVDEQRVIPPVDCHPSHGAGHLR